MKKGINIKQWGSNGVMKIFTMMAIATLTACAGGGGLLKGGGEGAIFFYDKGFVQSYVVTVRYINSATDSLEHGLAEAAKAMGITETAAYKHFEDKLAVVKGDPISQQAFERNLKVIQSAGEVAAIIQKKLQNTEFKLPESASESLSNADMQLRVAAQYQGFAAAGGVKIASEIKKGVKMDELFDLLIQGGSDNPLDFIKQVPENIISFGENFKTIYELVTVIDDTKDTTGINQKSDEIVNQTVDQGKEDVTSDIDKFGTGDDPEPKEGNGSSTGGLGIGLGGLSGAGAIK